jgi:hypothetical protein
VQKCWGTVRPLIFFGVNPVADLLSIVDQTDLFQALFCSGNALGIENKYVFTNL